jgi:hypothetical protein
LEKFKHAVNINRAWETIKREKFGNLYGSRNIIRMMKLRRMKVLVGNPEVKRPI